MSRCRRVSGTELMCGILDASASLLGPGFGSAPVSTSGSVRGLGPAYAVGSCPPSHPCRASEQERAGDHQGEEHERGQIAAHMAEEEGHRNLQRKGFVGGRKTSGEVESRTPRALTGPESIDRPG